MASHSRARDTHGSGKQGKSAAVLVTSGDGAWLVVENPKLLPGLSYPRDKGHKLSKKEMIQLATALLNAANR